MERISPFRHAALVRTVIPSQPADWHRNPIPSPRTAIVLSFRASPQAGVAIRSPRARRRGNPFFTCCLRRGTFVTSDKSTQKRRLKLRFKTSSARCARCQTCLIFLAQSPFPCFVVGQKDCATTAFRYRFAAATPCHDRSVPLYRRNLERVSPFRHAAPVRARHSEPVLTLARESVPPKAPSGTLYIVAA